MTLNDTVNLISSKAFYNLSDLETIKVSNSITEIEKEAFSYCIALEETTIPQFSSFYW